jgi:quercetin dioxygenase-like cupin family protein
VKSIFGQVDQRATLVVLMRGRFRVDLSVGTVRIERQGDYAVWGPGTDHTWQADADAVVVTVGWPSAARLNPRHRATKRLAGRPKAASGSGSS